MTDELLRRENLKRYLSRLPEGCYRKFKQLYSPLKPDAHINDIVNSIPAVEMLDLAIQQVKEALESEIKEETITIDFRKFEKKLGSKYHPRTVDKIIEILTESEYCAQEEFDEPEDITDAERYTGRVIPAVKIYRENEARKINL